MHIRTVRHPHASLFQSIIDNVLHRNQGPGTSRPTLEDPHVHAATIAAEHLAAGRELPADAPAAIANLPGGQKAWACIKLAAELLGAKVLRQHARADELERIFKDGTCDPGWLETIRVYLDYYGLSGHKHAVRYIPCRHDGSYACDTLPPSATVLLIGDWATGTALAKGLLREAASHDPDILIHLGDIYYAGTLHEAQANFLDVCNDVFDRSGGRLAIYNLAGNHDMYSGGVGYFDTLPRLNPAPPFLPEQAQRASYFSLRNPSNRFQLLAMDTGLHDADPFTVSTDVTWLEQAEADWLVRQIDSFASNGGRTILLSHHQLFTAFEAIGDPTTRTPELSAYNPNLLQTFKGVLEKDQVLAWFWGHEHNCAVYEPYGPLERGRCIGHGAIPIPKDTDPYVPDPRIVNPPRLVTDPKTSEPLRLPLDPAGEMYRHGYVILRLNDALGTATAEYYVGGEPETPFYTETLV
ncbi:MAG TPA: metallophosphoesterase [Vicinamibacterales bacterium]|nr:metallophosphoesterase [Vicinamibacterales bacterium]